MAKIKAFSDLQQSKKLAEFLPLESADMCYKCIGEDPYDVVLRPYSEWKEEYKGLLVGKEVDVVPCWSLAALLNVLPQGTGLLKSAIDETYHCDCPKGNVDEWFDNSVDVCYEMILKLHELNLL